MKILGVDIGETEMEKKILFQIREDWLALRQEEPIDPAMPIIDAHHHLWDRQNWRYLLDDLLADTNSGHNILGTVFVQARAIHRKDGPEEMKPVGETEFVNGVAAMAATPLTNSVSPIGANFTSPSARYMESHCA